MWRLTMVWQLTIILAAFCSIGQTQDDLPVLGIVNGQSADISKFPHQVALGIKGRIICGGSIIAPNAILTAGHCTIGRQANTLTIRAGSNYHFQGGQFIKVKDNIVHPEFTKATYQHDISILILEEPLTFNKKVQPIKLPEEDIPYGQVAKVSGWGATEEGLGASTILRFVTAVVFPRSECVSIYEERLGENMFCAGNMMEEKDSCQGDSGGPLTYKDTIIGVISWGRGCARLYRPGIYTNVYKYVTWIKSHVAL